MWLQEFHGISAISYSARMVLSWASPRHSLSIFFSRRLMDRIGGAVVICFDRGRIAVENNTNRVDAPRTMPPAHLALVTNPEDN